MDARSGRRTIPSEARWQQIERLLAAVAELARSHLETEEFGRRVLAQVADALPSAGAGFWAVDGDEQISLISSVPSDANCSAPPPVDPSRAALVRRVVATKSALVERIACLQISPSPGDGSVDAPQSATFLAAPLMVDDRCAGVLELIQADSQSADQTWALDVLGSVAELCAEDCRRRQMEWLAERELLWRRLRQFSLQLQRSLDANATAYAVVNDGRLLIDCDRLILLSTDEGRCRVLAVSGAVTCDPRSDALQRLEQMTLAITALGTPFVFPTLEATISAEDGLPPEIRVPVLAYLDAAGAKSLAVVPLRANSAGLQTVPACSAALVIEQFSRRVDAAVFERLQRVAEHTAPALDNARRFRQAPWSALIGEERWRRLIRGRSRLRLWLYAGAAIFVLGWIIPAPYEIEARGELQPKIRREVFAADDAFVEELKVDHDDRVEAGQVLAILRNPQLDLESKRVSGELQTARERLAAVQAARVEMAVESAGRPGAARLSGEEAGLRAMLGSLERQMKLLDEQQAALTVHSPIAGHVLTWDLPQLLEARPVQRGQVLMTIADPDGPWLLELYVPEKRMSALVKAREGDSKLPVAYVLATDPGQKHRAQIDDVATSVEPDRIDEPSVLVTVTIEHDRLKNPRPGAGATGRIDCGLRPIAYVWFHDLIDAAWAWLWF
jgi:multidrug efflux pump subunit AcrA (membrane-fusion protein)